jgi:hypothetical protein
MEKRGSILQSVRSGKALEEEEEMEKMRGV